MKIALKWVWIAGVLLLAQNVNSKEYLLSSQKTSKPGQFLRSLSLTQETLVILDLDDTTITTPEGQWLGRSDMFYDLLAQEQKKFPGKNKTDLATAIDPLLISVYQRVPVTVTDESLPSVLKSLNKRGVSVIAMTSRGKGVRAVTLEQLERVGVHFTSLGKSRWVNLDDKRAFRVEKNGVVFVGHGNKKGEVLAHLLKEKLIKIPKQIYLIDDREKHLNDVGNVLANSFPSVKYTPVLCTFPEGQKSYDSRAAQVQLTEFLIEHIDDREISLLLKNDPFTRAYTRHCPDHIPHHCDDCQMINMTRQ